MTKLIVDGIEVDVPAGATLLQACEAAGAEIPRFCFHERLSIAGNCRMCLVEVVGEPKPVASCARSVRDLRPGKDNAPPIVNTRTPMVKKAREGVMEFLLINHPLDCPICDQGGECDLQDQAMAYGVSKTRYHENKRAVEDKNIGPLVKTVMTRCIHCTRCVRFTAEVAGVGDLGAIGRGEDMEITTYLEAAMGSELQGNIIDLCPVGALTSKPFAFQARPWELTKTETIDVMDAVGSAIRVDARGNEVMRIMPRTNDAVNEEWISDKTRFIWDGLKSQRLDRPYIRDNGRLRPASFAEAFTLIASKIKATQGKRIGAIAGDLASVEEMYALKELMNALNSPNIDCRPDGTKLHPSGGRASYLFGSGIAGIDKADALLVIGSNPRREAAVLNARIRKRWRAGGFPIGFIGTKADTAWDYAYLGAGPETLGEMVAGNHPFVQTMKAAKHPMIIIGQGALSRVDGAAVLSLAAKAALALGVIGRSDDAGWNGFAVLHTAASRVGGLEIGFVPGKDGLDGRAMIRQGALDVLFLLGADEVALSPGTFAVYIGSHGDDGAQAADVVLPGAAYTEKSGIYVNTEGRVQQTERAVFPPGNAREDWAILRALSQTLEAKLPFDSLAQLRQALFSTFPDLAKTGSRLIADPATLSKIADMGMSADKAPFNEAIDDFYLTNPIARASAVMAECARLSTMRMTTAAE